MLSSRVHLRELLRPSSRVQASSGSPQLFFEGAVLLVPLIWSSRVPSPSGSSSSSRVCFFFRFPSYVLRGCRFLMVPLSLSSRVPSSNGSWSLATTTNKERRRHLLVGPCGREGRRSSTYSMARGEFPEPEKILNEKSPSLRHLLALHFKATSANAFLHFKRCSTSVQRGSSRDVPVIDYNIYTASSCEATAACAVRG